MVSISFPNPGAVLLPWQLESDLWSHPHEEIWFMVHYKFFLCISNNIVAMIKRSLHLLGLVALCSSAGTMAQLHWDCRSTLEQPTRDSWNPTPFTRSTASPGRLSRHQAWRRWWMGLKCWRFLWSPKTTWEWCELHRNHRVTHSQQSHTYHYTRSAAQSEMSLLCSFLSCLHLPNATSAFAFSLIVILY